MSRPHEKHWLVILIERTIVFLFQFSVLLLVLYAVGNFQEFLDQSQTYLVRGLTVSTALGVVLSLYMIVYQLFAVFVVKGEAKVRVLLFMMLLFFNAAVLTALQFFSAWFHL